MDFTNSVLRARGFDAEIWSATRGGKVLAEITRNHRFTLYEYFITDKIGHDQNFELAKKVLPDLAQMIRTVIETLDLNTSTVMMTSDHGNIEDLSRRNHTLNRVPTIIWGKDRNKIAQNIKSLADITPSIVKALNNQI